MGLCLGGVCSTELFEFSRTELRKWSTLEEEEEEPEGPATSDSEERLQVGETALCGVDVPSCVGHAAYTFSVNFGYSDL